VQDFPWKKSTQMKPKNNSKRLAEVRAKLPRLRTTVEEKFYHLPPAKIRRTMIPVTRLYFIYDVDETTGIVFFDKEFASTFFPDITTLYFDVLGDKTFLYMVGDLSAYTYSHNDADYVLKGMRKHMDELADSIINAGLKRKINAYQDLSIVFQ
jgi:hypothetical protein